VREHGKAYADRYYNPQVRRPACKHTERCGGQLRWVSTGLSHGIFPPVEMLHPGLSPELASLM